MQKRPCGGRRGLRAVLAGLLTAALLWGTGGSAMAVSGERTLIPVGRAIGIKLFSDGVLVVGLSEIDTESGPADPARKCGLKAGDIITHINSEEVDTIEQVQALLQELEGDSMSIRCLRGEKQLQMTVQPVKCAGDGTYKLGAWIRDSMAGIGTMTFYDPATGTFGALGHGINDIDTALLMPLETGGIMEASVTDVQKGTRGTPGQLHGAFGSGGDVGSLWANTDCGVFGTISNDAMLAGLKPVAVAPAEQVQTGPAVILSSVSGETVERYAVEITRIFPADDGDTRDMMLRVTDPKLLERTGGIVQGMGVIDNRDNTKKPGNTGFFSSYPKNDPTIGV